jgi:hypothetical protein
MPAAVGDLDRVDGRRRHDLRHADRAACSRRPRGPCANLQPDRHGDAREVGQRQAKHGAVPQELAPADAAGEEHIDQMILMRAAPAAQGVEGLVIDRHRLPLLSFLVLSAPRPN